MMSQFQESFIADAAPMANLAEAWTDDDDSGPLHSS